ncbi:MAG: TRAP transporter small permease [Pseudomonadota bacterium]
MSPPGTQKERNGHDPAIDLALPFRIAVTLALITVVLLTLAQIFFRFVLDAPLIWSEEVSRLLVVWMTFIGAAVVCWDGRHLNIDVFVNLMPAAMRMAVRVLNAALAIGLCIILVSPTLRLVEIENFAELGATELPAGVVRLPVAIGAVLMVAAIALRLLYRRRVGNTTHPTFMKDAM